MPHGVRRARAQRLVEKIQRRNPVGGQAERAVRHLNGHAWRLRKLPDIVPMRGVGR